MIIFHEVTHTLKTTKTPSMMHIKLDMSKDFNKLRWKYIHNILLAFGFHPFWVDWIISLTSSPFFSILVNGSPSKLFIPSQGIQQGDLLSPFLFILMAEGRKKFKVVFHSKKLERLKWHDNNILVSHNQFLDDNFPFLKRLMLSNRFLISSWKPWELPSIT